MDWLGKKPHGKDSILWSGMNSSETQKDHWEVNEKQFFTRDFKSAPRSFEVDSNGFSFLFSYDTDTALASHLNKPALDVYAGVWTKSKAKPEAGLIIAFESNNE